MHRAVFTIAAAALLAGIAAPAGAEEPPRIGLAEAPARAPRTLSELAARINLRRPDDGGPVVVSDQNLRELAGRGTLSVAGAPLEAPSAPLPETGPSEADLEEFRARVEEREAAVAEAERRLREFDTRAEAARDPYWGSGPQNFAPGQISQVDVVREDLQREVAAEREQLEELRREGRRTGLIPRR